MELMSGRYAIVVELLNGGAVQIRAQSRTLNALRLFVAHTVEVVNSERKYALWTADMK